MARRGNLNCLEKRDLLNQSAASVESLMKWGEHYESMGLVHDAVDFYAKANAREVLERLLENELKDCDVFLIRRLSRFLNREVNREEWLDVAKRSEEQEKFRFAAEAYRLGGDEDAAVRAQSGSKSGLSEVSPPAVEEGIGS